MDVLLKLQEENLALREQICALEHLLANGSPLVDKGCATTDEITATVIYHGISMEKRKQIEAFFSNINSNVNESEIDIEDNDSEEGEEEMYQPNCLSMYGGRCSDHLQCTCETRLLKLRGVVEYHQQYMLDWLGTPMMWRGGDYALPDELRVPYEQVYFQPFWVSGYEEKEEMRLRKVIRRCFNCGGDHHIRNCDKPINPFAVARSKIQFQEEAGILGSDKRYYLDMESQERFSKFQPGKMSDKLRAALSLGEGELPLFIIRMRELGYPPGWKLAKEEELKIFNESGEEIPSSRPPEDIVYPGYNDKALMIKVMDETISLSPNRKAEGDDDLGQLGDYEFDIEEEGGFILRKLAKEDVSVKESDDNKPVRSLDFPPGLVEVSNPTPPKGRWSELVKIIENEKKNF